MLIATRLERRGCIVDFTWQNFTRVYSTTILITKALQWDKISPTSSSLESLFGDQLLVGQA
jgi:hypothetical protein